MNHVSKQAVNSCSPSLWRDITAAGKVARLSGMKPMGEGVQHTPSDLAKPLEATYIDCNNSVLVSINLAKILLCLISVITAIGPLPQRTRT